MLHSIDSLDDLFSNGRLPACAGHSTAQKKTKLEEAREQHDP